MKKRRKKGFTLIELLIVIFITTVGFLSLSILAGATIKGLSQAKDLTEALNLAEHFLLTVRQEAVEWTNDTDQGVNQTKFKYLNNIPLAGTGTTSGWMRGYYKAGLMDQRVNSLGRDDGVGGYDSGILNEFGVNVGKRFCVHYRLTWLIDNLLIRVESRIIWLKENADINYYSDCHVGIENDTDFIYAITVPTTIMKNQSVD